MSNKHLLELTNNLEFSRSNKNNLKNINLKELEIYSYYTNRFADDNPFNEDNFSNILDSNRSNIKPYNNKFVTPKSLRNNYIKNNTEIRPLNNRNIQTIAVPPLQLNNTNNKLEVTTSTFESNFYLKILKTKSIDKYFARKRKIISNLNKNSARKLSPKSVSSNFSRYNNKIIKTKLKKNVSGLHSALGQLNNTNKSTEKLSKKNYKKLGNNFKKLSNEKKSLNKTDKFNFFKIRRKDYPFIFNPNPILPKKINEFPKNIVKINKKNINALRKENTKLFEQYFSIVDRGKFSNKFKNISDEHVVEENIKMKINEKYEDPNEKNSHKNYINDHNILWYKKLIKDLDKEICKTTIINKKPIIKFSFNKFKKELIFIKAKINNMSVSLSEVIATYKKITHSYNFRKSKDLIFAIKTKDIESSNKILDEYKFLVTDQDYFKMTPLHWAVKNNFYYIIPKIMEYGSKIEKKNFIGEKPLIIAINHHFLESVIFLFLYLASPFIKNKEGKNILECCGGDYRLRNICIEISKIHLRNVFNPTKNIYENIQKQFLPYILREYRHEIESDAYNILRAKMDFYKRRNKNQI